MNATTAIPPNTLIETNPSVDEFKKKLEDKHQENLKSKELHCKLKIKIQKQVH